MAKGGSMTESLQTGELLETRYDYSSYKIDVKQVYLLERTAI